MTQPNAIAILDPDNQKLECPVTKLRQHPKRTKLWFCLAYGQQLLIEERYLKTINGGFTL